MDPPGRFLDKNPSTGLYFEIGQKRAIEKTSQALRDGVARLRNKSSEDLGDPDLSNAVFEDKNLEEGQRLCPPQKSTMTGTQECAEIEKTSAENSMATDAALPGKKALEKIKVAKKVRCHLFAKKAIMCPASPYIFLCFE